MALIIHPGWQDVFNKMWRNTVIPPQFEQIIISAQVHVYRVYQQNVTDGYYSREYPLHHFFIQPVEKTHKWDQMVS